MKKNIKRITILLDEKYQSRADFLLSKTFGMTNLSLLFRYLIDKECGDNLKSIKIKRYTYKKPWPGYNCNIHKQELSDCNFKSLKDDKGISCMDNEKNLVKTLID